MKTQYLQPENGMSLTVNQKGNYSDENLIKFVTKTLESSLCDCSDAYILVTGNTVVGGDANTADGGNATKNREQK